MPHPRFSDLRDVDELARAVGIAVADIEQYAGAPDQASFYSRLPIPKRGYKRHGEFRVVYKAQEEWLAQLHRMIAILVTANVEFGEHVQGFVLGRSILSNARQHLGARRVLHADIRGFFDAITVATVEKSFRDLGATREMSELLARSCTIDGLLRQGTRCSPAIANLVCLGLDERMLRLAGKRTRYTRYADDMTFSGEETPEVDAVADILKSEGFELRDGSAFVQRIGRSQFVTGLSVADPSRPRLPRRLKRRLRLVLHYIESFGRDTHFAHPTKRPPVVRDYMKLEGMLRFVQSIEPKLARQLRRQYRVGSKKSRDRAEEAARTEAEGPVGESQD